VDVSLAWGDSKWVSLPSSMFSGWQNGTYKGIGIYIGSDDSSYYAICTKGLKLQITYA
jgi:hypothetical protein